ncbi:MAG TPA: hypothetical protein VN367_05145 [Chlorobaculum sp.]|nr:hypothetical protein [Chlorobaculum sp.]
MNSSTPTPNTESSNTELSATMISGQNGIIPLSSSKSLDRLPDLLKPILKRVISLLTASPSENKPLSTEERIIAGLAEKHSTIFIT